MSDLLLRDVRVVAIDPDAPTDPDAPIDPVDVLMRDGVITQVGPRLRPDGPAVPELDGGGRHVIPGLWDTHVHMVQWGLGQTRLDTSGTASPVEVLARVTDRLTWGFDSPTGVLVGWGHRTGRWLEQPTVAALDAVTGEVPVALISGDGHHGWLNTSALRLLGGPPVEGVVAEADWFPLYDRLQRLHGAQEESEYAVTRAIQGAHALGVVGIVDLEFGRPWEQWRERTAEGTPPLRARTGVYPEGLEDAIAAGMRTGDPIRATDGLVTMGPLKVITDGSLNTRTAWCCDPYADGHLLEQPAGAANYPVDELISLLRRAKGAGLDAALHAIGDAAVGAVLEAFATTGARGSIEHAQLIAPEDVRRWAALPQRVVASVQPAHLLDDRPVTERCWPDRTDRTFTLRSFLDAGIELSLGSDAPVSPLDPWLAMAAAVHRGPEDGESWHPEQEITPREALAASVDGQRVRVGDRADLALLEQAPLVEAGTSAERARRFRYTVVSGTVLDGQVVHGG